MKLLAVICEYNPFHNGHRYQLLTQKKELGCDGVICLMSGSFVQRGEAAIFDKWARAEMALSTGADVVIELPVVYATGSAELFARGGVSVLQALGVPMFLGFGSECGDLSLLNRAEALTACDDFSLRLQSFIKEGISYPAAYAKALSMQSGELSSVIDHPNDLLGVEYIRWTKAIGKNLTPVPIKRVLVHHDSLLARGSFASATLLRERLYKGEDMSDFIPASVSDVIFREIKEGRGPVSTEDLSNLIRFVLHREEGTSLKTISGVSEGLENRFKESATSNFSFSTIAEAVKTKRYTRTRINRTLIHILLGIKKEDEKLSPSYARVLGFSSKGTEILRELKEKSFLPIVTKTADFMPQTEAERRMFSLDLLATDLYAMLYPEKKEGRFGMDYYRSPVFIRSDESKIE